MINNSTLEVFKQASETLNNGGNIDSLDFVNYNKAAVFEAIHLLIEENATEELETLCKVLGISEIMQDSNLVYQD